ncbi:hypothetical protein OQA88_3946 [Cercophora sp. LCS_1]
MGTHLDANGETASLKKQKRKREPKDEASPTTKRHRTKSQSQERLNGKTEGARKGNGDLTQAVNGTKQQSDVALVPPDSSDVAVPTKPGAANLWKLSSPMGGRMLNIDPIFSIDERYLILAYNTSIQVYSTKDSLLVRRMALPITANELGAYIAACILSPTSPDFVWVACTDGRVWCINWTTGSGVNSPFTLNHKTIIDVAVGSVKFDETPRDVLLVLHKHEKHESKGQLVAYDDKALSENAGVLLHTMDESPHLVRSAVNCRVVVAAARSTVHFGSLKVKSSGHQTLNDLEYQFSAFGVPDLVACLDLRPTVKSKKGKPENIQQVDLAVGGARGAIYHYSDVLSKLPRGSNNLKAGAIQPRKYHWHRRAVHSIKFSSDGNYLVSGGYEQVLVLWQLDTNNMTFLPHLSGTIENLVVSPGGSSYAIHLDDNSTMIVSTEEMKPTAYVSGIQSVAHSDHQSKEAMVRRVWKPSDTIPAPLVAAQNPINSSQVVLCVGSGLQAADGSGLSTPQLQVFDVSSFQGITKHTIARTNPTEANITTQGVPIVDPTVTKLSFSTDGSWLASVDEWRPPVTDTEVFVAGSKTSEQIRSEKREIHLKFWEVGAGPDSLQLVTRVNDPHHTDWPETVFDLVSDPSSPRFATLGDDGVVRFWTAKLRRKDGLVTTASDGQQLRIWTCSQAITLPISGQLDASIEPSIRQSRSGALTFSDDGSILFAAFGEASEAAIVAIDTETGSIRETTYGMFRGAIRSIKSLGPYLILLSEDVAVYDIVSDELLYSYALKDTSETAKQFTQLAVNYESRCFALAAPIPTHHSKMKKGITSELVIFSVEDQEPQFSQTFPSLITSVTPAVGSAGFVVVDSAAQVWSVTEGAEAAPLLRSLSDLGLGDETGSTTEPAVPSLMLQDGDASDEEVPDEDQDVDMDMDEDFDIHPAVVAPQRLAEIFGAQPSFAMPPIQDIFYQVAGLFSSNVASTLRDTSA